MAIYNLEMDVSSNGATSKYDYNAREGIYSKGSRGEEIVYKESANMPNFAKDNPRFFWTCAESFERVGGNQYRKIEFSLPHELTDEENIKLAKTYIEKLLGSDYVYSLAIHKKKSRDGEVDNIHCHLMFSERKLDGVERAYNKFFNQPTGGGLRKERMWWNRSTLYTVRETWEEVLNQKLKENGHPLVSSKSIEKQREEAIKNGDFLLADSLDRPPVHMDGKVLQMFENNPNSAILYESKDYEVFQLICELKRLKEELYKIKVADLQVIENAKEKTSETKTEKENLNAILLTEINRHKTDSQPNQLRDIVITELIGEKYSSLVERFNTLQNEKPSGIKSIFIKWDKENEYKKIKETLSGLETPEMKEKIALRENILRSENENKITLLDNQLNTLNVGVDDINIKIQPFEITSLNTSLIDYEKPVENEEIASEMLLFNSVLERDIMKQNLLKTLENIEVKAEPKNLETMILQSLTNGKYVEYKTEVLRTKAELLNATTEEQKEHLKDKQKFLEKFFSDLETPDMKSKIIAKTDQVLKKYEETHTRLSQEFESLDKSTLSLKEAIEGLSEATKEDIISENTSRITELKEEKNTIDDLVKKQNKITNTEYIKEEIYNALSNNSYSETKEKIENIEDKLKGIDTSTITHKNLTDEVNLHKEFVSKLHATNISSKVAEIQLERREVYKELRVHQDAVKGQLRLAISKNNSLFKVGVKKDYLNDKGYKITFKNRSNSKGKKKVNTGILRTSCFDDERRREDDNANGL